MTRSPRTTFGKGRPPGRPQPRARRAPTEHELARREAEAHAQHQRQLRDQYYARQHASKEAA